jgi:multisubunit Na+/H+ antiporter MnhB subunit
VLVVALDVLVKGYDDVGDGFAAGIVAALGVLLQYVVFGRDAVARMLPVHRARTLAFVGLGVAVLVALAPLARGDALLEHAPAPGAEVTTIGTVELITAVAFDIGVFLLVVGAAVAIIDAIAATRGLRA